MCSAKNPFQVCLASHLQIVMSVSSQKPVPIAFNCLGVTKEFSKLLINQRILLRCSVILFQNVLAPKLQKTSHKQEKILASTRHGVLKDRSQPVRHLVTTSLNVPMLTTITGLLKELRIQTLG